MKRFLLAGAVALFYALHQDFWFWHTARPLVFGFLPIGLFYHAVYCLAAVLLFWLLVRHAWPEQLEKDVEQHGLAPEHRREGALR